MHAAVHAERLESLWRFLVRGDLSREHIARVLEEAAHGLEPEQQFSVFLAYLEGPTWVVDTKLLQSVRESGSAPRAGSEGVPFEAAVLERLNENGHAVQWGETAEVDGYRWRCCIGCRFRVGIQTYALVFSSTLPVLRAYARADLTFVELLAAFLGLFIREREQREALQHRVAHDDLTGILNRRGFLERLDERIASQRDRSFTLIVVDLDHYAHVNDVLGHDIGDAILQVVARRVAAMAGPADIVGRLSSDMFAVVLDGVDDDDRPAAFVARLFKRLAEPAHAGRELTRLTASAGIVFHPKDGESPEALLVRADMALERAKQKGRSRHEVFSDEAAAAFVRRRTLRGDLVRAIDEQEFALFLQPRLDLLTDHVVGAEALIRWKHPSRGWVLPADFVPYAEQSGLIDQIDSIVMSQSMRCARKLAEVRAGFRLFFNLSATHFCRKDFFAQFLHLVEHHAVDPGHLGVEITETAVMRDLDVAVETIEQLQKTGVEVALDDFGTGNSSFVVLRLLPVDVVKIGAPFIGGLPDEADDVAIVRTLITFAHHMRCSVTVEEVEGGAQLEWLRDHGCDHAQGYHICAPLPEPEFSAWLAETS